MSESPRDPDVRDQAVDAAWRERSREEPPRAVDDAIRAAARRAVTSAPARATSTGTSRPARGAWRPVAAAAAVAVLAFGLLRWLPRDAGVPIEPQAARPSAASAPATAEQPSPDAAAKELTETTASAQGAGAASDSALEAVRGETDRSGAETARAAAPPRAGLASPPPAPAIEPGPRFETEARERKQVLTEGGTHALSNPAGTMPASVPEQSQRADAAPASATGSGTSAISNATAAAPAVKSPAAAAAPATSQREPAAWVHEIEALHEAGLDDRAADRLRQFRASYADADEFLPETLRPWAASIKD